MTAVLVVVGSVAWLVCIIAAGSIGTNRRNAKRAARLPKQTSGPCGAE